MDRIKLLLVGLFFIVSCVNEQRPKDVLDQKKMIKVMADLHVIDGYISSLMYTDSMRAAGKNFYATVYKTNKITKQTYENSLKYYSAQPALLDSMYTQVDRILTAKEKRLNELQNAEQKKLTKSK